MSRSSFLPSRRRPAPPRFALGVLVALVLAVSLAGPAGAQSVEDPFVRRAQIEQRRQELLAELDELEATDEELQAVLVEMASRVQTQTAIVEAARLTLVAASRSAERAADAEAAKKAEVLDLEARMREMAVETYVSPPSDQRLLVVLRGGDLNDLNKAMVYFDAKFELDAQLAEDLERARAQLELRRDAARRAVTQAAARSDEVAAELAELEEATAGYEEFAAVVRTRMGEVDLEDAALRLESEEVDAELERRRGEILAIAGRGAAAQGPVALTEVRGIRIHVSLAAPLEAMLAAAEADGVVLRGGGYRSHEAQIQTRRNNCGDDPYSIWEKPAGECSPPTARPGTSMHELGMAIDFTYEGSIISTRSSKAFQWLAANAATYGFYNLPSEPWHWSANGN